jgi:hypothetical protein
MGRAEANPNFGAEGSVYPRSGLVPIARLDQLEALEKRVKELEEFRLALANHIMNFADFPK